MGRINGRIGEAIAFYALRAVILAQLAYVTAILAVNGVTAPTEHVATAAVLVEIGTACWYGGWLFGKRLFPVAALTLMQVLYCDPTFVALLLVGWFHKPILLFFTTLGLAYWLGRGFQEKKPC